MFQKHLADFRAINGLILRSFLIAESCLLLVHLCIGAGQGGWFGVVAAVLSHHIPPLQGAAVSFVRTQCALTHLNVPPGAET